MTLALSVEGVFHRYGTYLALEEVTLDVASGAFTVLLGVNGAGKSTLINLITRLFATQAGKIRVNGHDLNSAPFMALTQMGVIFQSRALDTGLTVAQNIIYQGALHGIPRCKALKRGEALLARVGLSERMNSKVRQLSGGQQRRVEIARTLLHQPRLLLCDEATVGLDVESRTSIVTDIHRMAAEDGLGVLWTTHLIDEVAPDDSVYVLHQGRILTHGSAVQIAGEQSLTDAFLTLTGSEA